MKNLLALMVCCGLGLLVLGCGGDAGTGGSDSGTDPAMPSTTGMADDGADTATDGDGGDAAEGEGGDAAEGEGGDAKEGDAKEGDAKEEAKKEGE